MLCDQFAEYLNSDNILKAPPHVREAVGEYAARVERAPRYVLDRNATIMALNLSAMPMSRFVAALPLCRLPHPRMWVEVANSDRIEWLDEARRRGYKVFDNPEAEPPKRIGYLFEALDEAGREFRVHLAWSHSPPEMSICFKGLRINADPDFAPPPSEVAEARRVIGTFGAGEGYPGVNVDQERAEVEANVEIFTRITLDIPEYMEPIWNYARRSAAAFRRMERASTDDMRSEWRFCLALIAAMNSRNLISLGEEIEFSRLNAARKRKGRAPLLAHREIRLSLSRGQRRRVEAFSAGCGMGSPAIVTGHFKVRKTGIYYWSAHTRLGGPPKMPTYRVTE